VPEEGIKLNRLERGMHGERQHAEMVDLTASSRRNVLEDGIGFICHSPGKNYGRQNNYVLFCWFRKLTGFVAKKR
jgi:hypothetical protein